MSAAMKAVWADPERRRARLAARDTYDETLQPVQLRTSATRDALDQVPLDPLEAALFGGPRR